MQVRGRKNPKPFALLMGQFYQDRLVGLQGKLNSVGFSPAEICGTKSQIGFKNLICCSQKWYSYRSTKPLIFKYAFRQMVVVSFKLKLRALNGEKVFKIRKCHLLCKGPFFA